MPIRTSAPVGAPIWIDLARRMSTAPGVLRRGVRLDLRVVGPEYGGYINAFSDGKPVAGLMSTIRSGTARTVDTYLTPDINATSTRRSRRRYRARAAGHQGEGWMGMLTDPTARLRAVAADGHRGFEVVNENGARRTSS